MESSYQVILSHDFKHTPPQLVPIGPVADLQLFLFRRPAVKARLDRCQRHRTVSFRATVLPRTTCYSENFLNTPRASVSSCVHRRKLPSWSCSKRRMSF